MTDKKDKKHPNLKRIRTTDEAREKGKKGGIESGKSRRAKSSFAEVGQAMVDSLVSSVHIDRLKKRFPDLTEEQLTYRVLMLKAQINKAILLGDSKAFETVRDTIGEKPIDKKKLFDSDEDAEKVRLIYIDKEEKEGYEKHIDETIAEQ